MADFLELTALLDDFLTDFLLLDFLPAVFFAEGFAAVFLRAADFPAPFDFLLTFFVAFFLTEFLEADFFVDLRADFFVDFFDAAGFLRAADFFFDAFFVEDFFTLTLRFLPGAFLLAADFRDAVVFLPPPARFCFLLAAFFAGIFHSCRSEKNAELYIGCPNMEAISACSSPVPRAFCSRSGRAVGDPRCRCREAARASAVKHVPQASSAEELAATKRA